jgi:hypothetical protein
MDSHLYKFNNLMYELLNFFNKGEVFKTSQSKESERFLYTECNDLEDDIIEYFLYRYK